MGSSALPRHLDSRNHLGQSLQRCRPDTQGRLKLVCSFLIQLKLEDFGLRKLIRIDLERHAIVNPPGDVVSERDADWIQYFLQGVAIGMLVSNVLVEVRPEGVEVP